VYKQVIRNKAEPMIKQGKRRLNIVSIVVFKTLRKRLVILCGQQPKQILPYIQAYHGYLYISARNQRTQLKFIVV